MSRQQVSWEELAALRPRGDGIRLSYGDASPEQFGILRLPRRAGRHPVVILVHGGCWEAAYDHRHVEPMAERLTQAGAATWVVEYRRPGQAGGGWPGTFDDVACGVDHLRSIASAHGLDMARVVIAGHSAGGHLALLAAARGSGLRPVGLVSLSGITDLVAYARGGGSCNAGAPALMGGTPDELPERYAAANPIRLAPLRLPLVLLHAGADGIVPPEHASAMATAELAAGGHARVVLVPGAGHFDLVAPVAAAWPVVEREIMGALGG